MIDVTPGYRFIIPADAYGRIVNNPKVRAAYDRWLAEEARGLRKATCGLKVAGGVTMDDIRCGRLTASG
jgi:hypothetical protein